MNNSARIGIRLSPDDKARIQSYAKKNAMDISEYILRCALEGITFRVVQEIRGELVRRPVEGSETIGADVAHESQMLQHSESYTKSQDHKRVRKPRH